MFSVTHGVLSFGGLSQVMKIVQQRQLGVLPVLLMQLEGYPLPFHIFCCQKLGDTPPLKPPVHPRGTGHKQPQVLELPRCRIGILRELMSEQNKRVYTKIGQPKLTELSFTFYKLSDCYI